MRANWTPESAKAIKSSPACPLPEESILTVKNFVGSIGNQL
jgi:hypothetical protein